MPIRCVDCPPDGHRRAIAPGCGPRTPLCATHQRERKRAARLRAKNARVGRVYGLDKEGRLYEAIYRVQGGRCAICRRAKGKARRLAVDHDHNARFSGADSVRGLLCSRCNSMLAHCHDDVDMLQRAVSYLFSPPARAIVTGLDTFKGERYEVDPFKPYRLRHSAFGHDYEV